MAAKKDVAAVEPEAEETQSLAPVETDEGVGTAAPSEDAPADPSAGPGPDVADQKGPLEELEEKVEQVVEPVVEAVKADFIALVNIVRNGREYKPGDPISFEPAVSRWLQTENGAEPEWSESPEQLAAHVEELKAKGAIREA